MFVTIINDCRDDNVRGRQESRIASLLKCNTSYVGVDSDLGAGVQLIDILDATEGRKGLILVNSAPRGGHTTKWENGTPFAYFYHKETLIISTVDGFALSAVKKLGLVNEVHLLDTHTAAETMLAAGFINEGHARRLPKSQFRSFDFIPHAGAFLLSGNELPTTPFSLDEIPELPPAVWFIDNFGNCKTTLTKDAIGDTAELATRFGTLPFIEQLRNVPDTQEAVTVGSSGFNDDRWLELVIQRTPFAAKHDVHVGDDLFSEQSYYRTATSLENDEIK